MGRGGGGESVLHCSSLFVCMYGVVAMMLFLFIVSPSSVLLPVLMKVCIVIVAFPGLPNTYIALLIVKHNLTVSSQI